MEYTGIISKRQERDQRWIIRIGIDANDSAFLFFATEPSVFEIERAAADYIARATVTPQTEELYMEEAERLIAKPECKAAVLAVVQIVMNLITKGLSPTNWTFQNYIDQAKVIIRANPTNLSDNLFLLMDLFELYMRWNIVIFNCYGDMCIAEALWDSLVEASGVSLDG